MLIDVGKAVMTKSGELTGRVANVEELAASNGLHIHAGRIGGAWPGQGLSPARVIHLEWPDLTIDIGAIWQMADTRNL